MFIRKMGGRSGKLKEPPFGDTGMQITICHWGKGMKPMFFYTKEEPSATRGVVQNLPVSWFQEKAVVEKELKEEASDAGGG